MNEPVSPRYPDLSSAIRGLAFPEHPSFPQLELASDPASMLKILRTHLQPMPGKALQITDCVPVRFRWSRSGSRCIGQYALSSDAAGRPPFPLWVTCVMYADPAEAERVWKELSASDHFRTVRRAPFIYEPLTLIADLRMVVRVFPYDPLMPNLSVVASGAWPELHQQLVACFGPGSWKIDGHIVEPLRYLTEDTAVLRYTLRARSAARSRIEARRFYFKAYRTRHGEQTEQLLRQIREGAAGSQRDFAVVAPVAYSVAHRCLVLAEAPGPSLQSALVAADGVVGAVRRVGRALAAFHESSIAVSKHQTAQQQLTFLSRAADLLGWACPTWRVLLDRVVRHVSAALRDVPSVPIHWDLKTDHVFLGERVTFVDLDTTCRGDPARDPAHLAAHIACRIDAPAMPLELARAAARALVEEYFSQVPVARRDQFQLQYAIAAIEGACGLFKRQEPAWRERAETAMREAECTLFGPPASHS